MGKDVFVNIVKCQIKGATVFNIEKGFDTRKPEIWNKLFKIAYYSSTRIPPPSSISTSVTIFCPRMCNGSKRRGRMRS